MVVEAQDVKVESISHDLDALEEMADLQLPSEKELREKLRNIPKQLDEWFESLPKNDAEPLEIKEIVLTSRAHSEQVRQAKVELKDETILNAETIHIQTSPEIWLVRATQATHGAPKYSIYSWYGIHDPSIQHLSAEGEITGGKVDANSHPGKEAISFIEICKRRFREIEVENKITGTPNFRNKELVSFLEAHEEELESDTIKMITELPTKTIKASLKEHKTICVGALGPYNRSDLIFYVDDTLQMDAVREACPALMQAHDILKQHGFSPFITTEVFKGAENKIPMVSLKFKTSEAFELVEMG